MKPNRLTALTAVLTFLALSATAVAVTPTKIQSDLLQIGRGASTADKTLEVNSNQGANNVKLVVPNATPQQLNVTTDTLKVGKSTAADKKIILDANAGAANPAIKWDNAAAKLQFANNGVDFKSFGSGSGGGGGINLIQDVNPDFEAGTTGWSASGGSFTVATSGGNLLFGTRSGVFNASAGSQTLTSAAITVTGAPAPGLAGANGEVSCFFKTTATDYKLQAYDGSNVLAERTIGASTYAVEQGASFPIPASGTVAVRIISASDATDLAVDDCYLGSLRSKSVAQSRIVGEAQIPATSNCTWQRTNTALGAFTSDADCPGPTVITNPGVCQIQTTDSDLPRVTCTNAPPGTYTVHARFTSSFTVTTALIQFALSDGTNMRGATTWRAGNGSDLQAMALSGTWTYLDAGTRSWDVYGAADSGVVEISNTADSRNLTFTILYSPAAEQQGLTFDQAAWGIEASIAGTGDAGLGTGVVAQWGVINNANLTLTNRTGSTAAQIACASGEEASGSTCSGNENIGIAFIPPYAGDFEVCAQFDVASGTTAGNFPGFTIVRTATTAVTVLDQIRRQTYSGGTNVGGTVCGALTLPVSKVALRLGYAQSAQTAESAIRLNPGLAASTNMVWTVKPLRQQFPAPLIIGGVVSKSSGVEGVERAKVTCSGSSAIVSQSGAWLSSVGNISGGACVYTIAPGVFSSDPACFFQEIAGAGAYYFHTVAATPTSLSIRGLNDAGANITAATGYLFCMGPR